jgi:hypothetical protein
MSEQTAPINVSDAIRHSRGRRLGSRSRHEMRKEPVRIDILEPLKALGLDPLDESAAIVEDRKMKKQRRGSATLLL